MNTSIKNKLNALPINLAIFFVCLGGNLPTLAKVADYKRRQQIRRAKREEGKKKKPIN